MALTRKMLKAMGIEEDKIDEIIEAHTETVTALKEQADAFKQDADKLKVVSAELETAKKAAENGDDAYKVKYDALKEDFDKYKADITAKEIKTNKINAYRELLKTAGINEKRIESVLKVSNVDGVELDEAGKIKNSESIAANVKVEWADFITTDGTQGAGTATPPAGTQKPDYNAMTDEDFYASTYAQNKK